MPKNYFLSDKDILNIENHYEKYFTQVGARKDDLILHEILSDGIHIDLEHYYPTKKFPYHIYATLGMSAYTMRKAPFENIELIMFLPENWQTDKTSFNDEKWYWPIKMLKCAARLPYISGSFLSVGHTFSMNEQNTPFATCTKMCAGLVTFPTWLDHGVFELNYGGTFNKKKVNFLCLTSITEQELKAIYTDGVQEFVENVLIKNGKDDLLVRNER